MPTQLHDSPACRDLHSFPAIDCFAPLRVAETTTPFEDPQYFRSWVAQPVQR